MDSLFQSVTPEIFNPVDVYEVKILLAYFLNKIGRCVTPAQLLEIATGDGVVNYFLYAEATKQMLENDTMVLVEQDGTEVYKLTEAGKNGAENFKRLVSKSVRDRIYSAGLKLFAKLRAEQEAIFELEPSGEGYMVKCVCKDGNLKLMDISLYAPDMEQAEYIKSKIQMNPSDFYSNVLDFVVKNEEFVPSIQD